MDKIRTRFAPSPTGYMHIGNLRTALYAYLFAKHSGGDFILRIEDTDSERFVEGATQIIYRTLKDVGLNWDEGPDIGGSFGPYVQSERKAMYMPYAEQLIRSGHAYRCFCTKEELEQRREETTQRGETFKYDKHCLKLSEDEIEANLSAGVPYVVRQNIPVAGQTSFEDEIFGTITVDNDTLDDNVLIKADGMPTYNFANVIDDHTMGITHVMRGMEYLSSTPKYNLLYNAFGWDIPKYIHLTPIMKDAQHKLSKRNGDASYEDLLAKGFLKEAIINYIALLGWNPGDEREMFTLEGLTEAFGLGGLSKSPAIFDILKLRHFNFEYVKLMSTDEFEKAMIPWVKDYIDTERFDTHRLAELLQPRCEVFSELGERVAFLSEMKDYDRAIYNNKKSKCTEETSRETLIALEGVLNALPVWNEQSIHDAVMEYITANALKNGFVLWPLRIALCGLESTPMGAFEMAALLGREEAMRRYKTGLEKLA